MSTAATPLIDPDRVPHRHESPLKVLMLSYRFPPENGSGVWRPYRFARYLPRHGVSPEVVSRPCATTSDHGLNVHRTLDTTSGSHSLRFRRRIAKAVQRILPYNEQLTWFPDAVETAAAVVRKHKIKLVYSTSPPIGTHLVAMELRRRLGLKWLADFRDPLWGNPFRVRRWCGPYDAAMERLILKRADALVVNTRAVGKLWAERYPQWVGKVSVLMNGFDPEDDLSPLPTSPGKRRAITHAGTLYGGRRPHVFLESVHRLMAAGRLDPESLRIRLIGQLEAGAGDVNAPPYSPLVERGCLEYTGQAIPIARAREAVRQSSFQLVLDQNATDASLQLPGKIFDCVRVGRPILTFTNQNSPIVDLLEKSGIPNQIIYKGFDPDRIDQCVLEFLQLSDEPRPVSPWFETTFDAYHQSRVLADILRGLEDPQK